MTGAFNMTLRGRLLLSVVIAFIPLLALEAYLLDAQAGALRQRILDERRAVARSEAQTVDTFIEGKIRTLQALASAPSIREAARGDLDGYLRAVTATDPTWLTVALSGADGLNLSSLTTAVRSVNISDRDYFQGSDRGQAHGRHGAPCAQHRTEDSRPRGAGRGGRRIEGRSQRRALADERGERAPPFATDRRRAGRGRS